MRWGQEGERRPISMEWIRLKEIGQAMGTKLDGKSWLRCDRTKRDSSKRSRPMLEARTLDLIGKGIHGTALRHWLRNW